MRLALCSTLLLAGVLAGCIPYTVGTTAQPVKTGTVVPSTSVLFIPNGFESLVDESATGAPAAYAAVDLEARLGLDEHSDIGMRFPGGSGFVLNYKRRLNVLPDAGAPAVALLVGGGVVNLGNHAYGELTLLASARQRPTLTPYGGLRAMHVLPLNRTAVSDEPTAGVFLGLRLGRATLGVSPELGVYYDPSALDLRETNVIVVPAVTFHGADLLGILFPGLRDYR